MRRLSHSSQLQVNAIKASVSSALFALEPRSVNIDKILADKTEGVLSPGLKHDTQSNMKFSNFGQLIKPTPFQTFSSKTSIDPQTFSSSLSPIGKMSIEQSCTISQDDFAPEITKTSENEQPDQNNRTRSILKSAENSRFSKENHDYRN